MTLTREEESRALRENEGLVHFVLRRFSDRHDFQDLLQLGRIGLLLAVRKFDASRGLRFSTMAVPWIFSMVSRKLTDENRECRNAKNEAMSLDAPIGDKTFGALIPDPHSGDAFEQAEERLQAEKYLSILSAREVRILRALASGVAWREIARREGVSSPRISQIRKRALAKIRERFEIVAGDTRN